jgi:putative transposase
MNRAVKLPLEVSLPDGDAIDGQSRILNWLFNHLLETANHEKQKFKETHCQEASKIVYTERGLRNLVPGLKEQFPFLKSCHSAPLKNAALRLSQSIRTYQDDKKKPKAQRLNRGWPKFRSSKKKFFSLDYDEYANGYQIKKFEGEWFLLLSLGKNQGGEKIQLRLKIKEMPAWIERSLVQAQEGFKVAQEKEKLKPKSSDAKKKLHIRQFLPFTELKVKRVGKTWHAILSAKKEVPQASEEIQSLAVIDPNHKNLGYLVDHQGDAIEILNLNFVKPLDKRIDDIRARRDLCKRNSVRIEREDGSYFYKPSRRWKFFQAYLDELHRVRREKIKSAMYCISNQLSQRYDFIAVGNYTPRGGGITTGMRRSMNNQSQIGSFKNTLSWVQGKKGKRYFVWDEKGSTKTCASCEKPHHESLDPSIRRWQCLHCGTHHIRDENAALNGFRRVLNQIQTKNLPGSGLLHELWKSKQIPKVQSRWTWEFTGSGISMSRASECVQSHLPRN